MKLTREQVLQIANLARIAVTEDDIPKYQQELSAILEYVEQLNEVDVTNIEPTSQVTGLENQTRPDVVNYHFTREEMLASAIETAEDHVKVKAVFKEKH